MVQVHADASLAQARAMPSVRWIGAYLPGLQAQPRAERRYDAGQRNAGRARARLPGENQDGLVSALAGFKAPK